MKHLFLEGPIQTGKSTLIRQFLASHMPEISGFTSQRLVQDGQTIAFRIAPASAPLTAPLETIAPGWPDTSREECLLHGIFKGFSPAGMVKYDDVFTGIGIDYIKEARHCGRLILLDEIGGHELAVPEYREALYEVLSGGTPCIGVIKHPENAHHMDATLMDLNLELHRKISNEYDGQILYYDRLDPAYASVPGKVQEFIESVFG